MLLFCHHRPRLVLMIENWPIQVNECYRDFTAAIRRRNWFPRDGMMVGNGGLPPQRSVLVLFRVHRVVMMKLVLVLVLYGFLPTSISTAVNFLNIVWTGPQF